MDLFALYMLLNGSGGGGANYTTIIEELNEKFELNLTTDMPIEEIITIISEIDEGIIYNTLINYQEEDISNG